MMNWLTQAIKEHKLIRRTLVLWAVCLTTWATLQMFTDITAINAAAATAFGVVTGLLTTVIGFYQWSRKDEDKADAEHR